jgi:hypothetical protein
LAAMNMQDFARHEARRLEVEDCADKVGNSHPIGCRASSCAYVSKAIGGCWVISSAMK